MKNIAATIKDKIPNNKSNKIIYLILIIIIVLFFGLIILLNNRTPDITNDYVLTILEKSSELTTAKITYTGMSRFEDNGIPIINKENFIMVYKAEARAGIDLKDVRVSVVGKKVHITIPKAKIISVRVDPSSIEYFDEKLSLFNPNPKEDANNAQALAEQKAKEEFSSMGVLEMADQQSATLIKGLLQGAIPDDYTIVVTMVDNPE